MPLQTSFQVGTDLLRYRNKVEMKAYKKTTLLRNDDGKEKQEDYPMHLLHVQEIQGSRLIFLFIHHSVVE